MPFDNIPVDVPLSDKPTIFEREVMWGFVRGGCRITLMSGGRYSASVWRGCSSGGWPSFATFEDAWQAVLTYVPWLEMRLGEHDFAAAGPLRPGHLISSCRFCGMDLKAYNLMPAASRDRCNGHPYHNYSARIIDDGGFKITVTGPENN